MVASHQNRAQRRLRVLVSDGCDLPSTGNWGSSNPAFAISHGPHNAPPPTPEHDRRLHGMLLSPSPFRVQVSQRAHEPPSESVPTVSGIQPGASWRTATGRRPGSPPVRPAGRLRHSRWHGRSTRSRCGDGRSATRRTTRRCGRATHPQAGGCPCRGAPCRSGARAATRSHRRRARAPSPARVPASHAAGAVALFATSPAPAARPAAHQDVRPQPALSSAAPRPAAACCARNGASGGQTLGECPADTGAVVAEKPAHRDMQQHLPTNDRSIRQLTLVAAVHPARGAATVRTSRLGRLRVEPDSHPGPLAEERPMRSPSRCESSTRRSRSSHRQYDQQAVLD